MPSDANIMEIHTDFKELLDWFCVSTAGRLFRKSPQGNKHIVEYLIVGGHALAFHGTTSISRVSREKADTEKVPGRYGRTPVCFISRDDFIANKRATGRKKDVADIEALGEQ